MRAMFARFCVQPRHWELEHIASDYYAGNVFLLCVQPRHWEWNTAQVTNMRDMFYYASAFNQDIGELEHRKSD